MTDEDIIARHRLGDREAFTELVQMYQRPIYYFALRMSGSEEDARDLTQRTFLRAYKALDRFEGRSSLKTWLFQIVGNLCRNHHRDGSRVEWVPEEDAGPLSVEPVAELALEASGMKAELKDAVGLLPPRQQSVLALRVYEDLPFKEIAKREGISVGNARVTYHLAVKALKERLSERAVEEVA